MPDRCSDRIHPQAQIDPAAILHPSVAVGPFTLIGADVEIGAGTCIGPHNVIKGPTRIGQNNRVFQFCTLGEDCQDLKYQGEPTELIIGDNNRFREYCSVHRGTVQDRGATSIASDNLLLCYNDVAHDCHLGDHCILSSTAQLAGHVHLGDWAIVSANAGVHQHCRIGAHGFVGAYSAVFQDVPAYTVVHGAPAVPRVVNVEGLKRRQFSAADIRAIQTAFRTLYKRKLSLADALTEIRQQMEAHPVVKPLYDSVASAKRNIVR